MPGTRTQLYRILEIPESGRLATWANAGLMTLILANVLAVVLGSVPAIYEAYPAWFGSFEVLSVSIFTVEYLARVWVSVEARPDMSPWRRRLRYLVTPMALVDLMAVLPFYLGTMVDLDMRFLRALRLFRVFKLSRYSVAWELLITVMRKELAIITSVMLAMLIIVVVAASGIYLIERDAQPDVFQSIPQAMWWAAVTLTTVGYGDVVPITVGGKIFGLFVTIAGVGMVALPAGILASGFSQELSKRRAAFSMEVRESLRGGMSTDRALEEMPKKLDYMGIAEDEARLIVRREAANQTPGTCPHCGALMQDSEG